MQVLFSVPALAAVETPFSMQIIEQQKNDSWESIRDVACSVKLPVPVVARMFGSFRVWTSEARKDTLDLGLGLKFIRAKAVVPGYARRVPPEKMANAVQGIVFEFSSTVR